MQLRGRVRERRQKRGLVRVPLSGSVPALEFAEPPEASRLTYEDVFFRMGRAGSPRGPHGRARPGPRRTPERRRPLPNRGESLRGGNCAARPSREPVRECLPFEEPPLIVSCVSTVDTGISAWGRARRLLARDAAGAETSESDPEASLFVSNSSARRAASFAAASAATSCGVRIRGGAPFRAHGSAGSAKSFTIRSSTGSSRGSPSKSATERGPSGERSASGRGFATEWTQARRGRVPRAAHLGPAPLLLLPRLPGLEPARGVAVRAHRALAVVAARRVGEILVSAAANGAAKRKKRRGAEARLRARLARASARQGAERAAPGGRGGACARAHLALPPGRDLRDLRQGLRHPPAGVSRLVGKRSRRRRCRRPVGGARRVRRNRRTMSRRTESRPPSRPCPRSRSYARPGKETRPGKSSWRWKSSTRRRAPSPDDRRRRRARRKLVGLRLRRRRFRGQRRRVLLHELHDVLGQGLVEPAPGVVGVVHDHHTPRRRQLARRRRHRVAVPRGPHAVAPGHREEALFPENASRFRSLPRTRIAFSPTAQGTSMDLAPNGYEIPTNPRALRSRLDASSATAAPRPYPDRVDALFVDAPQSRDETHRRPAIRAGAAHPRACPRSRRRRGCRSGAPRRRRAPAGAPAPPPAPSPCRRPGRGAGGTAPRPRRAPTATDRLNPVAATINLVPAQTQVPFSKTCTGVTRGRRGNCSYVVERVGVSQGAAFRVSLCHILGERDTSKT